MSAPPPYPATAYPPPKGRPPKYRMGSRLQPQILVIPHRPILSQAIHHRRILHRRTLLRPILRPQVQPNNGTVSELIYNSRLSASSISCAIVPATSSRIPRCSTTTIPSTAWRIRLSSFAARLRSTRSPTAPRQLLHSSVPGHALLLCRS
jgi:hypothetical protein